MYYSSILRANAIDRTLILTDLCFVRTTGNHAHGQTLERALKEILEDEGTVGSQ